MQRSLIGMLCLLSTSCVGFQARTIEGADPAIATSSPGSLLHTFIRQPPANFTRFGEGITGVGSNVLVGGELSHVADLYSSSTGAFLLAIPSPNPTADDGFGFSAAGSA